MSNILFGYGSSIDLIKPVHIINEIDTIEALGIKGVLCLVLQRMAE
jgi:hypothetical protein